MTRRRFWSHLIVGSAIWCGMSTPVTPALSADDAVRPAPALPGGRQTYPSARVPGSESAPSPAASGWSFDAIGALDLTYTDNVFLTATGRESDFILSPTASLAARRTSSRAVINANADVSYDYYTHNTRLNGVRPSALIDGFAEVVEETLTIDARLATNVQQISGEDRVPATPRNLDRNQTQLLNYGFSPTLRHRFGSSVQAEASYDLSGVNFLDPPVGAETVIADDSLRHSAEARLSNGDSFNRLGWSLAGYYEHMEPHGGVGESERRRAEAGAEYRVSGAWALTARGGYERINESTLLERPDGGYGLVGAIWRPSQRTRARVEAGYRYHDFNAEADIEYQHSEALVLSASFIRDVQTSQRLLIGSLAGLGRDAFGNLIDPISGLPPDPNRLDFDLTNQAFKRDQIRVGAHGRLGRNYYSASFDHEQRAADAADGESWGGQIVLGRDLTPRLQASVAASHDKTTADPGLGTGLRNSKTTTVSPRLDYEVTRTVTSSIRYVHMRRSTTVVRYRENAVVLNLTKVF